MVRPAHAEAWLAWLAFVARFVASATFFAAFFSGCTPSPRLEHLVWGRTRDGTTVTYRIDESGRRRERIDGIRIATSMGEWTWTTTTTHVPTEDCDTDGRFPAQPGQLTRAALAPTDRSRREQVVVEPTPIASTEPLNEIRQDVALAASLGPYLFVEDSVYVYACGAHGTTTKAFAVWDAERGAAVDLLETIPDLAGLVARANEELARSGPEALDYGAGEPPRLTEFLPDIDRGIRERRLAFVAQLTAPTCYACSDGSWGSYTRSVRLRAAPPPTLAAHALIPEAVMTFAKQAPDLTVGGWSSEPYHEGLHRPPRP